jgi:hypothetical protein
MISAAHIVIPFLVLAVVHGNQEFQQDIPNGYNVKYNGQSWPGVGHTRYSPGCIFEYIAFLNDFFPRKKGNVKASGS